jgi:hypothetical protein
MGHFSGPEGMNSPCGKITHAGIAEEFLLPLDIQGRANENLKSPIKIQNTTRLSLS